MKLDQKESRNSAEGLRCGIIDLHTEERWTEKFIIEPQIGDVVLMAGRTYIVKRRRIPSKEARNHQWEDMMLVVEAYS